MAGTFQPINLKEALEFLHSQHALVLAGGTDFMLKRARLTREDRPVLCVGHLEELRQIKISGQELRIGAACTLTQLLQSPLLPEYLKRPIAGMASPAIRNIATIGGNICNASPAGDALPMLYVLDAVLCLQSASGKEELPIQDFILSPAKTCLGGNRLLGEIRVPLEQDWRCVYQKVGLRRANSLSKLSFYALARGRPERLEDVRIAFGAVAPTVVRSREAELGILAGTGINDLQQAKERYDRLIQPIDDARSNRGYRRAVSLRLLEHFLREEGFN